jgi:3',5'-cyclic-AMP phosphodiesterase
MKNYSREVISFLHKLKTILSLLILCLLLLSSCTSNQPGSRFVFMTDIHVQPEQQAAQGFQTAIQRANELRPDFVSLPVAI